jgi:hypothetical protein
MRQEAAGSKCRQFEEENRKDADLSGRQGWTKVQRTCATRLQQSLQYIFDGDTASWKGWNA